MNGRETIDWLLWPTRAEVFFEDYWQKKPLLIRRNDPRYYSTLITLDDIDRILWTTLLPEYAIDMGKDAVPIPKHEFSDGNFIRPHEVVRHHRNGNTIILRSLHRWSGSLQELRSGCESFFYCPAQTNAYLTPASNHSSYPHFDAHDIFVLQLAGSKCWKFYETSLPWPRHTERFDRQHHPIGKYLSELTIHAGDIAYIPRGMAHDPTAVEYSAHIALGVLIPTWADLFEAMIQDLSYRHIELREALPVLYGQQAFDVERLRERFRVVGDLLINPVAAEEALHNIALHFVRTRKLFEPGKLKAVAKPIDLDPHTSVGMPENLIYLIRRSNGKLSIDFREVCLSMDGALEEIIRFLSRNTKFKISELPGEFTNGEKVDLVKRFIEDGLLKVLS